MESNSSNYDKDLDKWQRTTDEMAQRVKTYNHAVVSVGYATFFGALVFLEKSAPSPWVYVALLLIVVSASIFSVHALIEEVVTIFKIRSVDNRWGGLQGYKRWALFFLASLLCAVVAVAIIFSVIIDNIVKNINF